jgi:DUF2914 family protein
MNRTLSLLVLAAVAGPLAAQDSTRAAAAAAAPATGALSVAVGVVARSVVDRAPQDTGAAFPADVGGLVCFTQVEGASADAPGTIHHVWFHGDAQVADVELTARGSPWRTWSRKTVPADWTGPWHVEIRDAGGAVLKRIDFTVGQ